MKHKIAIGGSNFEEFIVNETLLVDKTSLIQDIIDDGNKVLLITRPRRWGKTLNMSMLEYFFSIPINEDGSIDEENRQEKIAVFSKMNISSHPEAIKAFCGQYPVIFISFKDVKESTYEAIKNSVKNVIYKLYATHAYLLQSQKLNDIDKTLINKYLTKHFDDAEFNDSFLNLSNMLYRHFGKKAIILIDEYDTSMNDWYAQALAKDMADDGSDYLLQQILSLFRSIFGAALKDNTNLEKAVVTGILRIAKASLFSGLNNLGEDSILDHKYARHFGFTEDEVSQLLHDAEMDRDEEAVQNLRSWYNGYNIGGVTIYNPWSIMNYLNSKGELRPYWVGTANTTLVENALILDKFQEETQKLIDGDTVKTIADPKMVFSDIKSSPDALYNLLLFSGYLTADFIQQNSDATYECNVRIPNNEIKGIFVGSIQKWLSTKFNIRNIEYKSFINELLKGEISNFIEQLKKYLAISSSFYSTGPKNAEVFYNGFMIGLISSVSQQYIVETEKESGTGRVDLMLIPKLGAEYKNALVIEFKLARKEESLKAAAKKAFEQIKSRNYEAKICNYDNVEKTIKLGLAFCGKEVEAVYE